MAELTKRDLHIDRVNDFVNTLAPSDEKAAFIMRVESIPAPLAEDQKRLILAGQVVAMAEHHMYRLLIRTAEIQVDKIMNEAMKKLPVGANQRLTLSPLRGFFIII